MDDKKKPRLKPISHERAEEIGLDYLYEAMRPSIEKDRSLLRLLPPEFVERVLENETTVSVSNQGQVTIPADIRRKMNLRPGDEVRFTLLGDSKVLLEPVPRERSAKMSGDASQQSEEP
jgi:AbrB family looped-hinge helix DNA binding protein